MKNMFNTGIYFKQEEPMHEINTNETQSKTETERFLAQSQASCEKEI